MKKLVFATNNINKLKEIKLAINNFEVIGLKDLYVDEEIPETGNTLKANSLQKAKYIYDKTGLNCFADDTGLEIDALNKRPGVYSARYAGLQSSSEDNMKKVLDELGLQINRKAKFRTVIALIYNGKEYFFEGQVEGEILKDRKGEDGFGYDPIFKPKDFNLSFAEMTIQQKNKISHRGIAVRKLINYLDKK